MSTPVDRFGDSNQVNTSNFNTMTLKFSEKFDQQFSLVFIFGTMFSENHGFVAMPLTSCIKYTCSNLSNLQCVSEGLLFTSKHNKGKL